MNKIYDIDYKRLLVLLLPIKLRKPGIFGIIYSLIKPVISMYDTFLSNRKNNLYLANITPQVCYLRKLLNDTFDPSLRRISVQSDGETNDWIILFSYTLFNTVDQKHPVWLSKNTYVKVSKQGNMNDYGYDFAILVPAELRNINNHNRIMSLVNNYKLASKRYIINYF